MMLNGLLSGFRFALDRAINRFVVQPRRERAWARKTEPFAYTNHLGNVFTLYPSEYVDRHIFHDGIYERRFLDLLRSHFPGSSIALDIGANIGNHAIYLAKTFARIHAFEPNPTAFARLRANVEANGLGSKIALHEIGLGEKDERVLFGENVVGNLGESGFIKDASAVDSRFSVKELEIARADTFIDALALPHLEFIKIDVEGWEPSVFAGLRGTIAKYRPIVAFEFHGQSVADGDFDRIMANLPGYLLAEAVHAPHDSPLIDKLKWNFTRQGKPKLAPVTVPESRTYENLLAFPDSESFERFKR